MDLCITPSRGIADLASNMLPFEIAIGPYDKSTRITSLRLDIGGNSLLVLHESVRTQDRSTFDVSYNQVLRGLTSATLVFTGALNKLSGGGDLQFE